MGFCRKSTQEPLFFYIPLFPLKKKMAYIWGKTWVSETGTTEIQKIIITNFTKPTTKKN